MSASTLCHGCGQRLQVPADYARAKMRCPECGVMCDVPPAAAGRKPVKQAARRAAPLPASPSPEPFGSEANLPIPLTPEVELPPRPPEPGFGTDDDDGKPYRVTQRPKECPQCGLTVAPADLQCPGCGWELEKKPKKAGPPAQRSWEAGWPYRKRFNVFILANMITVVLGILLMGKEGEWLGMATSVLTFAALSSFLLGTYPRVDLARDKRGKVTLTKTWRACFIERPPAHFDVLEFQGVRKGYASEVSAIDWFIVFMLLPAGIFPGIIWWYVFIQCDQHTVSLLREHGYASDVLYRGVSEDVAKDIANALEEIGGLPYENG